MTVQLLWGDRGASALDRKESVRGAPGIEMIHLDPEERPLCGLSKQEKLKKKKISPKTLTGDFISQADF